MSSAPFEMQPVSPKRGHIARIGVRVLEELVEMVVTGVVKDGESLPPEQALCDEFGVSRTVIRESIKRMQEKGLVVVAQGRGTQVRNFYDWNVLDPDVFDALVRHDKTLGVLDEVSVTRAALEGVMASEVARKKDGRQLDLVSAHLDDMRRLQSDFPAFLEADKQFHFATMEASGSRISAAIARSLFTRPLQSARWVGNNPTDAVELTLAEHERVFEAMEAGDPLAARVAMEEHILGSWRRRRLSDGDHHIHP